MTPGPRLPGGYCFVSWHINSRPELMSQRKKQEKKNNGKTKPQTEGKRRRRRRRRVPDEETHTSQLPAQIGFTSKLSGPNMVSLGRIFDRETGLSGDRFRFRQPMVPVIAAYANGVGPVAGNDYVLHNTANLYPVSGYVYNPVGGIYQSTGWLLGPNGQGHRLSILSNIYSDYVYRRLNIEYRPVAGTNQFQQSSTTTQTAGQLALSISRDPYLWPEDGNGNGVASFTEVAATSPGETFPPWGSTSSKPISLTLDYKGSKTWKTQFSQALTGETAADLRLEHQYRMCAMLSNRVASSAGNPSLYTYGYLEMSGVIDFYGPVSGISSNGFTTTPTLKRHKVEVPNLDSDGDVVMLDEKTSTPCGLVKPILKSSSKK